MTKWHLQLLGITGVNVQNNPTYKHHVKLDKEDNTSWNKLYFMPYFSDTIPKSDVNFGWVFSTKRNSRNGTN